MVGRTGSGTQTLHFLHQERDKRVGVLNARLGLLIEIGLVGRAAPFGHHEEAVLHTFGSLNIYLGRQIALGIHLVVHIERSILAVAQVLLGVSLIYSLR